MATDSDSMATVNLCGDNLLSLVLSTSYKRRNCILNKCESKEKRPPVGQRVGASAFIYLCLVIVRKALVLNNSLMIVKILC